MTKKELKKELDRMKYIEGEYEKNVDNYLYYVEARESGHTFIADFKCRCIRLDKNGELIWVALYYDEIEEKILNKRMGRDWDIVFMIYIGPIENRRVFKLKPVYMTYKQIIYFEPVEEIGGVELIMTKEEKIELLENKVNSLIQNYFKIQKEIPKTLKELTELDDSFKGLYDHLMEKQNEMEKEERKKSKKKEN